MNFKRLINLVFFSYHFIGDLMLDIRHFINDTSFQILYINNSLDIINYTNINYMEDSKISLDYYGKKLLIKGNNLSVKKLLESEILITGSIISIEFIQ